MRLLTNIVIGASISVKALLVLEIHFHLLWATLHSDLERANDIVNSWGYPYILVGVLYIIAIIPACYVLSGAFVKKTNKGGSK